MRLTVIVALAVLCAWLFTERHTLTESNANLEMELAQTRKEVDMLKGKSTVQKSWLEQRMEESRGALNTPAIRTGGVNRAYPGYYPAYPYTPYPTQRR
jgi:hypothetical protein